jgi:hypothetical protein
MAGVACNPSQSLIPTVFLFGPEGALNEYNGFYADVIPKYLPSMIDQLDQAWATIMERAANAALARNG